MTNYDIGQALQAADNAGYEPGIYRRGKQCWRVHLNTASNPWEDVASLEEAAEWLFRKMSEQKKRAVASHD